VSPDHTIEGIARVVRVEDGVAWFEPEQTTSCGHCASAAVCGTGSGGVGTLARRIELRRFSLDIPVDLRVGERVVVGVADRALIKGALTAYAIPLAMALAAGGIAQGFAGEDLITMAAMVSGLFGGLLLARITARRLSRQGELSPHYLRRAAPGETCHTG
jgi:sigma-E factor negative regulatory protein RseC